jgi:hypothetical protein
MIKALSVFCILMFYFFVQTVRSQTVPNTINLYGDNFPAEKIYIHFDKERYLPGETVWFKAYVFEENLPSLRSTNFYAALYDDNGKMVQQKVYPIFNATTDGFFQLPDTLHSSKFTFRAFTKWMLNFDTAFLYTHSIGIRTDVPATAPAVSRVSLNFFPEGGQLIEGITNTVAFKANYNDGLPFPVSGSIKKEGTDAAAASINDLHNGMGKFSLSPVAGERYYAEWTDQNGVKQRTDLPAVKTAGISLRLLNQGNQLAYMVVNKTQSDTVRLVAYMYQRVIYKANLPVKMNGQFSGYIPLGDFPAGVVQVTAFDNNWQPLAERICFSNNANATATATVTVKEHSTAKRGKNIIEIEVPDTVLTNMSMSVTDAEINKEPVGNTIFAGMLLNGDIRGAVYDAAYYFRKNDAATREHMDLVMLTHGWRKYNWDDMAAGKMPQVKYPADNYLTVYAQVNSAVLDRLAKDEQVTLMIKSQDSTTDMHFLQPDSKGMMKKEGLIFYDTAKVYVSFNKNKSLNRQMGIAGYNYTMPQPSFIRPVNSPGRSDTVNTAVADALAMYKYYNKGNNTPEGKTLLDVSVSNKRNWRNNPMQKMEERYVSGMFRGGANAASFDVMNDESAQNQFDIYSYLAYRTPGLRVVNSNKMGAGKSFLVRSIADEMEPMIFIDEHVADNDQLQNIPITSIAYVKVIYTYFGAKNDNEQFGPAVVVYLKKGRDLDEKPSENDLVMVKVPGYAPIKEFYSPDYATLPKTTGTDARTTLYWQPYIVTSKANHKVPVTFYNNDFSSKLRIVIEGINDDGKLVHIEKEIE